MRTEKRLIVLLLTLSFAGTAVAENREAALGRLSGDLKYLAGDALEGRGVDTEGNRKAAEFIRDQFEAAGLVGGMEDGGFFQEFPITLAEDVVPNETSLSVTIGDEQVALELGKDFNPLLIGNGGRANAGLVFAGYGINAPKLGYNDFEGVDLSGKIAVILRKEPQQDDPNSVFNGTEISPHAFIRTKIKAAADAGAAGLILVNDPTTAEGKKGDELVKPTGFGSGSVKLPFAMITQTQFNRVLQTSPLKGTDQSALSSVKEIANAIDADLKPISQPIGDTAAGLTVATKRETVTVPNVVGVVPGSGDLADEVIVVGAHFDHLGYGGFGSRKPGVKAVHNGADDNASGTAVLMELARRLGQQDGSQPRRQLVFMAFNGEERGLLGSNYLLKNSPVDLSKVAAMVNLDMVGRLGAKPLTVYGVGTGTGLEDLAKSLAEKRQLKIKPVQGVIGASDHYGFYQKDIPSIHLFTGTTPEYHTPEDDFETLDLAGIVGVTEYAGDLVAALSTESQRRTFQKVVSKNRKGGPGGNMAHLGVVPDYSGGVVGLRITGTSPGSPAAKGGLEEDDIITKMGDIPVTDIYGLMNGLRTYKPGERIDIVVTRGDEEVTLHVVLGEPKGRHE
ncbi:M28 family peptidase [Stratiformator vulcanicus]|uniref:Aminopeptidase YwaD n=1 Tax=Stratiformator vulcanicus TaxID=2527980 RepID=A0A517R2X9_9PLAN|nr:M28 family peptidase [Stratiformator vulcanicus]QDT38211.1 Aminopeptidase YwaD precursor [Stratiformator vulcanicus]